MSELKQFTLKEVEASDAKTTHHLVIDNYVYDVTPFLDEHPGGHEVLVASVGKDATEDFQDIGHSIDAKELMKKYRVGELAEADRRSGGGARSVNWQAHGQPLDADSPGFLSSWKFPLVLGLLVTVLYSYLFA